MMNKYKLNYLIMLVFTVSSCVGREKSQAIAEVEARMKAVSISEIDISVSERQRPLIMKAIEIGQLETEKIIEEAGIQLKKSDLSSIIKLAITRGYFEVVQLLRDAGVKVDAENDLLIKLASINFELIKSLQAIYSAKDKLLDETIFISRSVLSEGDLEIKKALSEVGVKVDGKNQLLTKVLTVHLDILKILLQANLHQRSIKKAKAIEIALAKGHLVLVKALSEISIKTDVASETSIKTDVASESIKTDIESKASANVKKCNGVFKD